MVLSHKLITNRFNYLIKDRNIILLIIIHLHIAKKINDAKLKALFKNYRNGTLNRLVNTYYCRINNKWYNDELMKVIYLDIYADMEKKDLTVDEILPYINLLLNKNKNYCIDFIYQQYIEPISTLTYYSYGEIFDIFDSFKINGIELISFDEAKGLDYGYCCSDCSGDYEEYKYNMYQDLMSDDYKKKFIDKVKSFLRGKKTASSYKNPNNILF